MYGVFQVQSSENLQVADLTLEILWGCQVTKTLVPWLLNTERHQTSDKKNQRGECLSTNMLCVKEF